MKTEYVVLIGAAVVVAGVVIYFKTRPTKPTQPSPLASVTSAISAIANAYSASKTSSKTTSSGSDSVAQATAYDLSDSMASSYGSQAP